MKKKQNIEVSSPVLYFFFALQNWQFFFLQIMKT